MTSGAREMRVAAPTESLAGDLHDVIAHQASIVVIQANAAQRLIVRDPAAALRALRSAGRTATETVADLERLRRLLGDQ